MALTAMDLRAFAALFAFSIDQQSTPEATRDAIFVSIDLARTGSEHGPSDIGVSILDSRCFASLLRGDKDHAHHILSSHYWFSRRRRPGRRAKKGFRLGEIYHIPISNTVELRQALTHIFCRFRHSPSPNTCCASAAYPSISLDTTSCPDTNTQSQLADPTLYRPVILVGHDLESDLRCLRKIDFDPATVAPIVACLDTQKIAYGLYGKTFRLSDLCWHRDIRVSRFHISGNDAAYTLLALLRMATETSDRTSTENVQGIISTVLQGPRSSIQRPQTIAPFDWADNLGSFDAIDDTLQ